MLEKTETEDEVVYPGEVAEKLPTMMTVKKKQNVLNHLTVELDNVISKITTLSRRRDKLVEKIKEVSDAPLA